MNQAISSSSLTASRVVTRRRLLVRRDQPVRPFVWGGLLPTLGLMGLMAYAVWPFARGEIEAQVQRNISATFVNQGMPDVKVNVSGQHVLLTGQLKPGVSTLDALKLAREATCPTWLGPQVCAELVIGNFESLPSLPDVPALPAVKATPAETAPTASSKEACDKGLMEAVSARRIEFASGSAALLASSGPILDAVAKAHAQCSGVVRVEGHTDNLGDSALNARLSLARAQAVRGELIQRGVPADRLVADGFGPAQPLADNATPEGRKANRRIEFKMAPPN